MAWHGSRAKDVVSVTDDNLAIRFPFFLNPLAETIMHFTGSTHECISFFLPGA